MHERFKQMPDATRVWVYAFNRELSEEDNVKATGILDAFLPQWVSHGVPVIGAYEIVEDRFLLLAGYCNEGIGGCSTDSSVRVVKEIEQALGLNAFDRNLVFFRDGAGKVVAVSRADFQELVNQSHVSAETTVFDTTIQELGDLRSGRFETTFDQSWHARAFTHPDKNRRHS